MRVNLSASEILKLAEQIIANSNKAHNSVASVPLDKVLSICIYMLHWILISFIYWIIITYKYKTSSHLLRNVAILSFTGEIIFEILKHFARYLILQLDQGEVGSIFFSRPTVLVPESI